MDIVPKRFNLYSLKATPRTSRCGLAQLMECHNSKEKGSISFSDIRSYICMRQKHSLLGIRLVLVQIDEELSIAETLIETSYQLMY